MAEITVTITGLSADDLKRIKDIPTEIDTLLKTVKQTLDGINNKTAKGNPLTGLFGALSTVAGDAEKLPGFDNILQSVKKISSEIPGTDLVNPAEVKAQIEAFINDLGPFKGMLLSGKLHGGFQEVLNKGLDLAKDLVKEKDILGDAGEKLEQFFRLFGMMLSWQKGTPKIEEVVDLLSHSFIGVAPDLLQQASAKLDLALAPIKNLLPAGADLDSWRASFDEQLSLWLKIKARVEGQGNIDWPALQAELQQARLRLLGTIAARDRLFSATLSNLNQLKIKGMNDVASALSKIPKIEVPSLTPLFEQMRREMKNYVLALTSWTPTPDDLRKMVRALVDRILHFIDESPLGQIRLFLIEFQQTMLRAIESLPFKDLAHKAETALLKLAAAADVLDPEAIRRPIREFFGGLKKKIDELPLDDIRNAIKSIWKAVEDALNQVKGLIETLQKTLQQAINGLKAYVDKAKPTLEQIKTAVASIKTTLESFDLNQPAEVVVGELHKIRDVVAKLDVSSLPGPAVAALKTGAEMLRGIDITGSVKDPIDKELGKIDPTPLLKKASESLGGFVAGFKALDPATIGAQLDKPVDEILKALSQVGPDGLRKALDAALLPIKDAVKQLDFAKLLAPLTNLFQELKAKVDAVLNPELIFKPLEELYKPIIKVIDALDPAKLIDLITPHGETLSNNLKSATPAPAAFTSKGGILKKNLQEHPESKDDLFGFRPGDMLIPLIDIHHQFMASFGHVADDALAQAAKLLKTSLFDRIRDLNPQEITRRVQTAVFNAGLEFDAAAITNRLSDASLAYDAAVQKIGAAARAQLPSNAKPVAEQVLSLLRDLDPLALIPDISQHEGLISAQVNVQANVDLGDLGASFASVGERFENLLPSFLKSAELTAADVRQALEALDPAPVREEINKLFDDLGHRLVGLEEALMAAIEELAMAAEKYLLPISPANIIELAHRLYAAAREQVLAFSPATFKDEIKKLFDVIKNQLNVLDPSVIVQELTGLRDELMHKLEELAHGLIPDSAAFDDLQKRLAALKPSQLLKDISAALKPVTELVALLDPSNLLQPLIEVIAKIRTQIPDALAKVEAGFDDVLAAFPEGGGGGVSARVQVSVG